MVVCCLQTWLFVVHSFGCLLFAGVIVVYKYGHLLFTEVVIVNGFGCLLFADVIVFVFRHTPPGLVVDYLLLLILNLRFCTFSLGFIIVLGLY